MSKQTDMTLSEELAWRGFVNQSTFADTAELDKETRTFYWGVDPSADSMTVGNFAMAMMARHFMNHGYKAVLLVGGATGMIGDPDGKAEERSLRPLEEIEHNKKAIAAQYDRVFDGMPFTLVDNYDWFRDMGYLNFLRDVGKHFSMTQLLQRDFVQNRIGEGGAGISYAEFSYSLIQGYDFLHLFRKHGVTLQIAASDQWGNSISGTNLIRKLEGAQAHVWTGPLIINAATGKKFGKTEDGAIWLDEKKTSVYKFYQFWLNVDDRGVIHYLKIYTLLSPDDITRLEHSLQQNPGAREAQKALAYEVTKLVHGEARAESVRRVSEVLFGKRAFADLDAADHDELAKEIPVVTEAETVGEALLAAQLATSSSEARRLISGGGISVSGEKLTEDGPVPSRPALLKRGKNGFALIR
ncbi:tyrosine--tRNA ligase [Candidatus Saccharibacteria bacterium]|nr:tyrosine--tRNA ligase [Candidatus Saccharibacteria bacterium]